MKQYLDLLKDVYDNGTYKNDRTNTGTYSVFGRQARFDLSDGFPLLTTKKVHFKSIVHELLWFLSGSTNIAYLKANGVSIWDAWATDEGNLGPIYGEQWRKWPGPDGTFTDQISEVIGEIKSNPNSRRLVVSAWNPSVLPLEYLDPSNNAQIGLQALPPCHCLFQFYVTDGKLSCQLYQRSGDVFLGVPFNIASYALLTHMIAHVTGLEVGEFIHTFGDLHLYSNHVEQATEQLNRMPSNLPTLHLNEGIKDIFDFTYGDIQLVDYDPDSTIKAPVAI